MKAVILCDGEPPSQALLLQHLQRAELVICTDGATRWVLERGVRPHVVVGDMDSSDLAMDCEVVDCGPHDQQENTDAEKALLLALERGADEIILLGATGQRLDHTLGNVWLVARYHDRADVLLIDDYSVLRVISVCHRLQAPKGSVVSLLALTPEVLLTTQGLKWPLEGVLEPGTRGLSNETVAAEVVIDVQSGLLAVITGA